MYIRQTCQFLSTPATLMGTSYVLRYLIATINNRYLSLFPSSFLQPLTPNILTFIQYISPYSSHTYLHLPSCIYCWKTALTDATLCTSGPRTCTIYASYYGISMQCWYLACSLPSSRAYSRAYRKLTLSSRSNSGQLKGQFIDRKSVV